MPNEKPNDLSHARQTSRRRPTAKKSRISKVSIERIQKILRLIRRKGAASMQYLMDELEVSQASVKRDLDFLKDRLGCPLEWDASKRGYLIHDDLVDGGRFELPGIWFDASEVLSLLMMLHLVEGVQPGLLEEHVGALKTRLRSMLAEGSKTSKSIERKVKLIHFAPRKVEPKHFQAVAGSLLEGKKVQLRYWNRDRKESSQRDISPLQLVHYRENWVLDAWCHKQDGLRSFALEAIEEVKVLDEPAREVSQTSMREHFQSGYGIFAGKAQHRASLKFSPERAQWVALETWHPDQTSELLRDGSYVLEVPYSNDQELVMDLLRHGAEVEVLAPPQLREKMRIALFAAAKKYAGD